MRILAIETTEAIGTVAALEHGNVLREHQLDPTQRSAQSLVPSIGKLLAEIGWQPQDVRLTSVTIGPGSFTGLRVGVTAAKTLAYAVGAEVLGIDTLEAIAAGVPREISAVAVAVDAQRGDVVAATFQRDEQGWFRPAVRAMLIEAKAWLASLPPGMPLAGPILKRLSRYVPDHLSVLEKPFWHPQAANVGRIAARDYAAGRRDSVWTLLPHYSRRSAAEERLG